jgi:DNA-directed RNA polymerase subunit K/omega
MNSNEFTKYERARILGARALQIAMNAPLLIKINKEDLEKIRFDALKIAEIELNSDILPISVRRPMPKKKKEKLKRAKEIQLSEKKKKEIEAQEAKEIAAGGEIMQLATPEDEIEETDVKAVEE